MLADTPTDQQSSAVSGWAVVGVAAAVAMLIMIYRASDDGFIPLLDHANLAFHEAGHVFFGIFGSTLGLYGGTLGQLVFPVAVTVSFLRKGSLVAAAFGLVWLFQNFLNIARYVADARTQALPLVGGGDHDWTQILARWRALSADTSIARTLTVLAWMGMVATVIWIALVWRRNRENS
jgi:hypothetical protein